MINYIISSVTFLIAGIICSIISNKYYPQYGKPIKQCYYTSLFFSKFFIRIFFISVLFPTTNYVIKDLTGMDFFSMWLHTSRISKIISFGLIGLFMYNRITNVVSSQRNYRFLCNIPYSCKHPVDVCEYCLIDLLSRKDVLEKRIAFLKNFSLLPILLLFLNNMAGCSMETFNFKKFVVSDTLNAVLILALAVYTYILISTLSQFESICSDIATVEQIRFQCQHPELFQDKDTDINPVLSHKAK